jgi:DNA damage-inducible protein 1
MSIMTSTFVEQCYLGRLVDKRFKGMAVGVGSSTIIGKVHQVSS